MHPVRRRRLTAVIGVVLCSVMAVAMIGYGFKEKIDYYYLPSNFLQAEVAVGRQVRLGGLVLENSLKHHQTLPQLQFVVTDQHGGQVVVYYRGILPDLFAEGAGVVVSGSVDNNGLFRATQVFAKHDENYQPPQITTDATIQSQY